MPERPAIRCEEAAEILAEFYDLVGSVDALPGERDRNFLLHGKDGPSHVLKVAPPHEQRIELEAQIAALEWLEHRAPDLPVPRVVPTVGGQCLATWQANGLTHRARLFTYLPGVPLVGVVPHGRDLLQDAGRLVGRLQQALQGFHHAGTSRELVWHPDGGIATIERNFSSLPAGPRRECLDELIESLERRLTPRLGELRRGVIHNDANDHNLLVHCHPSGDQVTGLIDFGDLVDGPIVMDAAIAAAYCMLSHPKPLEAMQWVLEGVHAAFPLHPCEIEVFFDMVRLRLGMSAAIGLRQLAEEPDNAYLGISQGPVWAALEGLRAVDPDRTRMQMRHACGLPASPHGARLREWLNREPVRLLDVPVDASGQSGAESTAVRPGVVVLDLSVRSEDLATLGPDWTAAELESVIHHKLARGGAPLAIGRYGEPRLLYSSSVFRTAHEGDAATAADAANHREAGIEPTRTVHLGIDLFVAAGTVVLAPCDGRVHSLQRNAGPLDYGPTLILEHEPEPGLRFFTLLGHLAEECLHRLRPGQEVHQGEELARVGTAEVNGGWPPHLHFQVIADLGGARGDFPGVATPDEAGFWLDLCPSPRRWLGLPDAADATEARGLDALLAARRQTLGPSLGLSYRQPLAIVRGRGTYLYDRLGRRYLDAVNNVPHVGHSHPRVVAAASRQAAVLNTNTRYLHDAILDYSRRLCDLFPAPLSVCYLTCSGSEANELALRLARVHTARRDVLVLDGAYHGNTTTLVDLSPYKHAGPGGSGAPPWVHVLDRPDPYRGRHRGPDSAPAYLHDVRGRIQELERRGHAMAAVLAEPLMGCGGQIVPPSGYLRGLFDLAAAAGAVRIADEVQVGFGRVGEAMWAFELDDALPDIVTLGKPIGNGHPLGAVVTTEAIARSFDNGMEYFNTFGGNPVSCQVGLAVLDVIEEEHLMDRARQVGRSLRHGLEVVARRHPLIGDIRGRGLFLGIELVLDRDGRQPAPTHAAQVVERMRGRGILLSSDGPDHNVLKIKPPLTFSEQDAQVFCEALDQVLSATGLQV